MSFDPRRVTLGQFDAPVFWAECLRCRRSAELQKHVMLRRYGEGTSLHEAARMMAVDAGCAQAADYSTFGCGVMVREISVTAWGTLEVARKREMGAWLLCRRRFAALKKADSCTTAFRLDIDTLIAALGHGFPMANLALRCKCPLCSTSHVEVQWLPNGQGPSGTEEMVDLAERGRRGAEKVLRRANAQVAPNSYFAKPGD